MGGAGAVTMLGLELAGRAICLIESELGGVRLNAESANAVSMIGHSQRDDDLGKLDVGMIGDQKNGKVGEIVLERKVLLASANVDDKNDRPLIDQVRLVFDQCQFPMILQYEDERILLRRCVVWQD